MFFRKYAPDLHSIGYQVIPVRGKRPAISEWESIGITADTVSHWASNGQAECSVGIRTGQGDVAIYGFDCDIYDGAVAKAVRTAFWERFGEAPLRIGQKPKSLSVYRGESGFAKINSPTWVDPEGREHKVELLGNGQQFVAYGTHPGTGRPYEWIGDDLLSTESFDVPYIDLVEVAQWINSELPKLIPADWKIKGGWSGATASITAGGDMDIIDMIKPRLDITDAELEEYVSCIDPECDYDTWAIVMFGIHHQTGGSDEGFDIFNRQSKRSSKYDANVTRYKWSKIKTDLRARTITAASIIKLAKETAEWATRKVAKSKEALSEWEQRICDCNDPDELERICSNVVTDGGLSISGRVRIEGALINRFKALNVPMTKTTLKDIFKEAKKAGAATWVSRVGGSPAPWSDAYVWCQSDDCFIHIETQQLVSVQSFNARHGRDVKGIWMTPDGIQMSASHVALQEVQIPVVMRRMYLPSADQKFACDGIDYLNMYRPSSVPDASDASIWTTDDKAAVDLVESHIRMLCGKSSDYVIWWMAHNVQLPGIKIRHAPLIKGIEGDGKSLIGNIMEQGLGKENVRVISPRVLLTDFNGWAEGQCVGIFEEIRIPGHNRHDAANAIKPNITNDSIPVHRKGKDEYNVPNTCNYIAFTNYSDALPLTETDRRWHIIFSPFSCPKELLEKVGADYFDRLFKAIREHAAAIRGWLLSQDISGFDANGRAPDSDAKRSMIASARSDVDELIMDIIDAGHPGVTPTVISTKHLATAILMTESDVELKTSNYKTHLSKLGFTKVEKGIKWRGEFVRTWVKGSNLLNDNHAIRDELDKSLVEKIDQKTDGDYEIPF